MRAFVLLRLAARSVGRNVRRSALTAAAMVVGLALLIFSRALAEGGHEQWIDSAVALAAGHVAIQAPGYLQSGDIEDILDEEAFRRARAAVEALDTTGVVAWTSRLSVGGLASSSSSALPVQVVGVDPDREPEFSALQDELVEGRYLQAGDRLQAFVGVEFARRLDLEVGDRFVLTAQGATGEVVAQLMRVAGTFRTAIPEMDEGLVHVPIATVRTWLQAPGSVSTLAILLESARLTEPTVRALKRLTGGDDGLAVLGWRETSPELDSAIRIDDYGDYVFHVILFAIVALAILNSVMMSVLGRRREFGILQAMGLTAGETGLVVFAEGLFLTAASGVVGVVVGFLVTWGLFRDGLDFSSLMENEMSFSGGIVETVIVPEFHLAQVWLSVLSILVVGTLASIYPALRATRLDVAEAMKFDR